MNADPRTGRRSIRRQDVDLPVDGLLPSVGAILGRGLVGGDKTGAGAGANDGGGGGSQPEALPSCETPGAEHNQFGLVCLEMVEDHIGGRALTNDDVDFGDSSGQKLGTGLGGCGAICAVVLNGEDRYPRLGRERK